MEEHISDDPTTCKSKRAMQRGLPELCSYTAVQWISTCISLNVLTDSQSIVDKIFTNDDYC